MIRPYQPADRQAILAITVCAFDGVSIDQNIERRLGILGGVGWQKRKAAHLVADLADRPDDVLVAERDGQVVGYVTTRVDTPAGIGRILNLAVAPEHQGQGIGTRLLQAALEHLRAEGMQCARIETLEQNARCAALYPTLGFQEVARQIHYVLPLDPPQPPTT